MSGSKEEITESITSDKLHNKNCFNYLRNVKLPSSVIALKLLPPDMVTALLSLQTKTKDDYDPSFPYADLYTKFFDYLEDNIEAIYDETKYALLLDSNRIKVYQEQINSGRKFIAPEFQKSYIRGLGVLSSIQEIREVKPTENTNGRTFEEVLDLKAKRLEEEVDALDDFIYSLYANDNRILEDTFENIKEITLKHTPNSPGIQKSISHHLSDKEDPINRESNSPAYEGSAIGRFTAMMSDNYKPQHGTSLSTVRHYKSNAGGPIEYRFGTQGQRHNGEARVSPLFERFITIEAEREDARVELAKRERAERLTAKKEHAQARTEIEEVDEVIDEDKITHIYFNFLGRDRTDAEGLKEKALTEKLEELELHTNTDGTQSGHKNIAVITLPADKELMSGHAYANTEPKHDIHDVKEEFLRIAQESSDATTKVKDFHISERIRQKIFCDKKGNYSSETEARILNQLLDKSFKALGYSNKTELSDAERQAVWFHFIKYELTNHIIESLKPKSINFSCKDAIDRGGVASAYYNLLKSFEPLTEKEEKAGIVKVAMSREEFDQALHAAPTMVKGRGMNHHINLIWNSVDAYVNENYEQLTKDPQKAWLIEWRDFNCPHERVEGLLQRRIQECKKELSSCIEREQQGLQQESISPKLKALKQGMMVLDEIQKQTSIGVSGKRLLLETTLRTTSMAISPETQTKESCNRYQKLHDKLSIKFPELNVLTGLMKVFVGTIVNTVLSALSAVSGGKIDIKSDITSRGWATFNAGLEIASRKSLQQGMKEQLSVMKNNNNEMSHDARSVASEEPNAIDTEVFSNMELKT